MEISLRDLNPGMGLTAVPVGAPSPAGTHNVYAVRGVKVCDNPAWHEFCARDPEFTSGVDVYLIFQDGNPAVNGKNGATTESILLACAERLEIFQKNPGTACVENQAALDYLKQCIYALNQRTVRLEHEREMKA